MGREKDEREKDRESREMGNSTTEEYGRLEEEMQIWMIVNRDRAENYKQRMRLRQSENQEGAEKMSGAEIQKYREIERKKKQM